MRRIHERNLAVIRITAFVDHPNGLDEGLLKDIIGDIAVLDHHADVIAYAATVTFDQSGYGAPVPRKVVIKQYLVT